MISIQRNKSFLGYKLYPVLSRFRIASKLIHPKGGWLLIDKPYPHSPITAHGVAGKPQTAQKAENKAGGRGKQPQFSSYH
jgi:hypothetical protein